MVTSLTPFFHYLLTTSDYTYILMVNNRWLSTHSSITTQNHEKTGSKNVKKSTFLDHFWAKIVKKPIFGDFGQKHRSQALNPNKELFFWLFSKRSETVMKCLEIVYESTLNFTTPTSGSGFAKTVKKWSFSRFGQIFFSVILTTFQKSSKWSKMVKTRKMKI